MALTAAQCVADLADSLDRVGQIIQVRRYSSPGVFVDISARARVVGAGGRGLVGETMQAARKVILLAADLQSAAFDFPLTDADKIVVQGEELAIMEPPDDSTRRVGNVLIAYEIQVRG